MADLVTFSELPLKLVFKVRQLKNYLPNDSVNQVLTNGLNESGLYLELNINEALNAKTERKAVEELRHAYQKTGSVRYYIELLKEKKLSLNSLQMICSLIAKQSDKRLNRSWKIIAANMTICRRMSFTIGLIRCSVMMKDRKMISICDEK